MPRTGPPPRVETSLKGCSYIPALDDRTRGTRNLQLFSSNCIIIIILIDRSNRDEEEKKILFVKFPENYPERMQLYPRT